MESLDNGCHPSGREVSLSLNISDRGHHSGRKSLEKGPLHVSSEGGLVVGGKTFQLRFRARKGAVVGGKSCSYSCRKGFKLVY